MQLSATALCTQIFARQESMSVTSFENLHSIYHLGNLHGLVFIC